MPPPALLVASSDSVDIKASLFAARTAAWALLLSGWIGLGTLATTSGHGGIAAYAPAAMLLLGLGLVAAALERWRLHVGALTMLLVVAALAAASAVLVAVGGGGLPALVVAALAWAALTVGASRAVRALRAGNGPTALIAGSALLGAANAVLVLGDPIDGDGLAGRLAACPLVAALVLALLVRRAAPTAFAKRGCRAALFDCALAAAPASAWRNPSAWPELAASYAMLPMMCALPAMLSLCRGDGWPGPGLVALHLLAMFVPGTLLVHGMRGCAPAVIGRCCAACLIAGAAAALFASRADAMIAIAVLHGGAWSLAWFARMARPAGNAEPVRCAPPAHVRAGVLNAFIVIVIGAFVSATGAAALTSVHALLGVVAAMAMLLAWLQSSPATASARRITPPG